MGRLGAGACGGGNLNCGDTVDCFRTVGSIFWGMAIGDGVA